MTQVILATQCVGRHKATGFPPPWHPQGVDRMNPNIEPVATSGSGPSLSELLRPLVGSNSTVERPDGTTLHVIEEGTGPDVLLVHGFGVSADSWSLVQPDLVDLGRRVVAYDQRAHGQSSCGSSGIGSRQLFDDLHAVAAATNITDGTLVCHSMGNFVGLGALADEGFSRRFKRAVLVAPVTGHSSKGAPVARFQGPLIEYGVAQALARRPRIGRSLAAASLGPGVSADVLEATRQVLTEVPMSASPYLGLLRRESVEDILAKITVPLHILTGTADRTTPAWHAELIAARAAHAHIETVPDAAHMLNWEAPERVVRAIIAD
ncbi:alpha/beta fold hydrolase [Nocardia sp. NPDC059240]|uniref:alpha/beta fold hydrolase n=1 Tax=Nocardia sp. NPDC059240 TaxID=3346786 RepID=UPI0036C482F0